MNLKGLKQVVEGNYTPQDGYLYFVRTSDNKTDGYIYFNGKKYGTGNNTKDYADELNDSMNERVTVIESWKFATKADIDKILNGTHEDPEEPDVPQEPTENVGTITENNAIEIDESQLENGTYTLKYIDSEDNVVDNFNEIITFEINN
jgi:hypothetical protein